MSPATTLANMLQVVARRDPHDYPDELMTLMQFTGLKDKNGREIYEGDVVQVNESQWTVAWYAQLAAFWLMSVGPINTETRMTSAGAPARDWNWLNGGKAVYWHTYDNESIGITEDVKVIGNIYENPELLAE